MKTLVTKSLQPITDLRQPIVGSPTVDTTSEDPATVDTTSEDPATVDTTSEDPATVDTTSEGVTLENLPNTRGTSVDSSPSSTYDFLGSFDAAIDMLGYVESLMGRTVRFGSMEWQAFLNYVHSNSNWNSQQGVLGAFDLFVSLGFLKPSVFDRIMSEHTISCSPENSLSKGDDENSSKSQEEQLKDLESKLEDYQRDLEFILSNPDSSMTSLASSLARFFETYGKYMQMSSTFDMSKADSWLASNTLYNDCVELINNRLQQTYARENWLYQQEYNLPANAIARLMEAGINPAFYFGSLDKSNAGAIETPSLQTPQQPSAISGEVPWMRKLNGALGVVGALGQIGGLFNEGIGAISGSTLNMSQALLNQFMTENGQRLQPYQIANLESVTAMNNALTKTEDETRSGKVAVNWARILEVENNAWYQKQQIKMHKKQLKNALKIAEMSNDTNLRIADINSASQKYLAQIQKEMNEQRIAADGYLSILPYMEDYNVDEEYWDSETGESFSRDEMLNSTFKAQMDGGTAVNIPLVGNAHANGQISNEDFEGWKENTTKTIGGRNYTKRQVTRRTFNPARYNQALEFIDKAYKDLKRGKITSEQFHYAKGSAYRIIQEEQDNVNKYCIDKGLVEMFHGYLPSMDYMK